MTGIAAAFLWIAAINMIDASMMVDGRVVDRRGRPRPATVSLQIGNRTISRPTTADGRFTVYVTTTFLKHDARLIVSRGESRVETPLVAPGRHHLEVMTGR